MKNLLYIFLAFGILFSSCEEETDDPFNPTASFSCKIDGVQLSDSYPSANIITTNQALNGGLEISATSNLPGARVMNTVNLKIYNFSSVTENTPISLGSSGSGQVWQGADIYSTEIPSYTGTVSFSKITANKVSGTFDFIARDQSTSVIVEVIDGSFSNVSY
jgi:hypothetical protein